MESKSTFDEASDSDQDRDGLGNNGSIMGNLAEPFEIRKLGDHEMEFKKEKKQLKMIGKYLIGHVLGEGSYGKVKQGYDTKKGIMVALKIMSIRNLRKIPGGEESVFREIQVTKEIFSRRRLFSTDNKRGGKCCKDCVVRIFDSFVDNYKGKLYIVMEFLDGGSLQELCEKVTDSVTDAKFPLSQVRHIMVELLSCLVALHSKGIIHRDIKPDNVSFHKFLFTDQVFQVLLSRDQRVKLSDFGVAWIEGSGPPVGEGSPAFQSPEVVNLSSGETSSSKPTEKVDIWAAGVIFFMITTGKYPFDQSNLISMLEEIEGGKYVIPEELRKEKDLLEALEAMLNTDPQQRPSAEKCLEFSWFQSDWSKESRNSLRTARTVPDEDWISLRECSSFIDLTGPLQPKRGCLCQLL